MCQKRGRKVSQPKIKKGSWIVIKSDENSHGIDGYVFDVYSNGELSVGYYQNDTKGIKENVMWNGSFWVFKSSGPDGTYLSKTDEALVKRGPYN